MYFNLSISEGFDGPYLVIVPSEDSGQPVHLSRLTSLLCAHYGELRNQGLFNCADAKADPSLCWVHTLC